MRKHIITCLALFAFIAFLSAELPTTVKDIPVFPAAKIDAEKNQGELASVVADSAAQYKEEADSIASRTDLDLDSLQGFDQTMRSDHSNFYTDAPPEAVAAWYLKTVGNVAQDEPDSASLSVGVTSQAGISNLEPYDEAKVFTRYQYQIDGPATFHDGALYKKVLQGRAKASYGWLYRLDVAWTHRETATDYTRLTVEIVDRGFSMNHGKESYLSRTEIRTGMVTVRRHPAIELLARNAGSDGAVALQGVLKKLSSPDAMSLMKIIGGLNDADAKALADLVLAPLTSANVLVQPSPNAMLDFGNLLKLWKPGAPIAIVPLIDTTPPDALTRYYEGKTGKKAASDGKGSMIIVLKGSSLQTAEQGILILPRSPGSSVTMVMVMKSRPGKP